MGIRSFLSSFVLLFICTGCASTQGAGDSSAANQITFSQVKAAPDSFKGQTVMFGGQVLNARRLKEGTRVEILQLPLDRSGQPGYDLTQSQGRFVAMHRDFLDPATLPYGTLVTVTGQVAGSIPLPLDETEYTYPIIDIADLRVWIHVQDTAPCMRPCAWPGPYWGPYWGPYSGPWPYRW